MPWRAVPLPGHHGGEPLLHPEQVNAFLRHAGQLYPDAHTRLYTCGDLLDERSLQELAESGLDEIRFSIKPPDAGDGQDRVYELMEQAVGTIPAVVVEVPVIPGSLGQMKDLLVRSDALGISGVNLLEFCFPLHNAAEFAKRGFQLRKHPFKYLYNYWYGGGVPVAGSEAEALELLAFAEREGLRLGIHYCSSDNKNTGQIYQQNKAFFAGPGAAGCPPVDARGRGRPVPEVCEGLRGGCAPGEGMGRGRRRGLRLRPGTCRASAPCGRRRRGAGGGLPSIVLAESVNVVGGARAGRRAGPGRARRAPRTLPAGGGRRA